MKHSKIQAIDALTFHHRLGASLQYKPRNSTPVGWHSNQACTCEWCSINCHSCIAGEKISLHHHTTEHNHHSFKHFYGVIIYKESACFARSLLVCTQHQLPSTSHHSIEHMHILADHVTLSINQLQKLVSSPTASLARAPKRRRLEWNRPLLESTRGKHWL